jgi:hypothetical protein
MELNKQTEKVFGVVSTDEAEEINKERSMFDKIFNPIDSRVVSDDVRSLFLDPEANLADLVATKRPEGIGVFDIFSSDPKKRELAWYGESKVDRRDLLALKDDKEFQEEFANIQNDRAATARKESENSLRNVSYDFLTERLNLDPSTAQAVVTTAEFVPFVGDAPMIEDAFDQFKRGDIKEGALTTLLATAGIAFDGIPILVNGFKKAMNPPQMIVGEKSKLADKVASKEIMESRQLTKPSSDYYDDDIGVSAVSELPFELRQKIANEEIRISTYGPNKGKLVEDVPETEFNPEGESIIPLKTSAERLQDSKNTFRKFYRDNNIMHSGDIITDLKKMPEEQREKTKGMLRELWLKNGWTVGKNNKFYTEIDDSYLLGTPFKPSAAVANKHFKFKMFLNEQKEDLVNGGLTLPRPLKDVLAHPKLYEAYPQLKNLAIRVMTKDDSDAFDRIGGHYDYNGRDGVSEIVMKVDGFEGKDFTVGRVKELSESDAFTQKFMQTLVHELQHAIQHIEGLNYNASRSLGKSRIEKARETLSRFVPLHLSEFKKRDAELKNLNPKDYDPKDNYSDYKILERDRNNAKRQLEERAYQLDELNNLDLEDEFSDVNYYDTMREAEARLSGSPNRLYYGMDARMETAPFDDMTTQSKGISGLDILRKASADKNGRVDFDKYHKMRTKVLEPIFKQREEGDKILDKAFEDLTGIKLDIKVPDKYSDWLFGDLSYKAQRDKYVDILNNSTVSFMVGHSRQKYHPRQVEKAIKILDIKLENVASKVKRNPVNIRSTLSLGDTGAERQRTLDIADDSPYVLVKFSDETKQKPNSNIDELEGNSFIFKSEKPMDLEYKPISSPNKKVKFYSDEYTEGYTEYFFVREKDLVYNTLHRKRMPTDYKTVKGEVESISFDQEADIKRVYDDPPPFWDVEDWIKENLAINKPNRVTNTDDNVTFNLYDANNFSTHPLLRTLLKRQSTSGPAGVNKFNRINMTTQKLKPRVTRRKFKDSEKFLASYKDDYNTSLNEWANDMVMRKEDLRLEQMKDYNLMVGNPPHTIVEDNKGQATIDEIFSQIKSPYGNLEIKDPVYLPDDYDYYSANTGFFRRK